MRVVAVVPTVLLALAPVLVGQTTDRPPRAGLFVKVDADDLVDAYVTNEAFADRTYTGKLVQLSGKMQRVYRPAVRTNDAAYILELEAKEGVEFYLCFPEQEQEPLAQLKKTQPVTIRGRCLGLSREKKKGTETGRTWITFAACRVIEAPDDTK